MTPLEISSSIALLSRTRTGSGEATARRRPPLSLIINHPFADASMRAVSSSTTAPDRVARRPEGGICGIHLNSCQQRHQLTVRQHFLEALLEQIPDQAFVLGLEHVVHVIGPRTSRDGRDGGSQVVSIGHDQLRRGRPTPL